MGVGSVVNFKHYRQWWCNCITWYQVSASNKQTRNKLYCSPKCSGIHRGKEYNDNLEMTKKIVKFCHEKGVSVQAELGSVPYLGEVEMGNVDWDKYMTNPVQAQDFVEDTGIDALAVAIGNAHGFFKERSEPDYARLEMIDKNTGDTPMILHGASDWENGRVAEVIKRGISAFNVDTALRIAFVNNLINSTKNQGETSFDVRKLLGGAREAVKEEVKKKMKIFGSDGKAW